MIAGATEEEAIAALVVHGGDFQAAARGLGTVSDTVLAYRWGRDVNFARRVGTAMLRAGPFPLHGVAPCRQCQGKQLIFDGVARAAVEHQSHVALGKRCPRCLGLGREKKRADWRA